MKRRALLGGFVTIVAGCSTGDSESENSPVTASPSETNTPTATSTLTATQTETTGTKTPNRPQQANAHITEAQEHLTTAVEEYRQELNDISFTASRPEFDARPTTEAIRIAREDLDAAATTATPNQQSLIEALRSYTDFLENLLGVMDDFIQSLEYRSTARSYEQQGRYHDAVNNLERARNTLQSARSQLRDTRSAFQSILSELDSPDKVAAADVESNLTRLEELFNSFATVYKGDLKLERGTIDYNRGIEHFNQEDYDIAVTGFSNAETHFLKAENIYADGESGSPTDLLDLILYGQCRSDKLATAAHEMRRASILASKDPQKAREHVQTASEALDQTC